MNPPQGRASPGPAGATGIRMYQGPASCRSVPEARGDSRPAWRFTPGMVTVTERRGVDGERRQEAAQEDPQAQVQEAPQEDASPAPEVGRAAGPSSLFPPGRP